VSASARGPRVAVIAEFYPSRRDPVLGVWAHRQALAAQQAGAEVRVIVLHRLVPPRAALAAGPREAARSIAALLREPRKQVRDGLSVTTRPIPPARALLSAVGTAVPSALALHQLRRTFLFELTTPTTPFRPATPPAASPHTPLVVSVHGGDVEHRRRGAQGAHVARAPRAARLVLANSQASLLARARGAHETLVVHPAPTFRAPALPASAGRSQRPRRRSSPSPTSRPQAPRRRGCAGRAEDRHQGCLLDRRRRP
jgi:hypothetical protein